MMNILDEVASVFWFLEDYACQKLYDGEDVAEYDNFDEAREEYSKALSALDKEPWKDGKHLGDCTNFPATCMRCVVEDYRGQAQKWLKEFTDKYYE